MQNNIQDRLVAFVWTLLCVLTATPMYIFCRANLSAAALLLDEFRKCQLAGENCEENSLNTLGMSDAVSFISPDQRRRWAPSTTW